MTIKNILFFSIILILVQPVFSQAVTRTYVNFDEEVMNSKTAVYYVEAYKTNAADIYWQRKMYFNDTTHGILASTGQSKDQAGLIKEGIFIYYQKNGKKQGEGSYLNNIKEGEWKQWSESGNLSTVNHYKNGKMIGHNISWYGKGPLKDSAVLDDKGNGNGLEYYENGHRMGEGNYSLGSKHGLWVYYYEGIKDQKSVEVVYEMDSVTTFTCFTEKGEVQKKNCVFEKEATFRGGDEGWKRYLIKKLTEKLTSYEKYLRANQLYTVIVRFVVNKDGDLVEIGAENPDIPELDEIAVKIIEASPRWIPAVQYNRKVNAYRRQPISFFVGEE